MSNVEASVLRNIGNLVGFGVFVLFFETGFYHVTKAGWICHVAQGWPLLITLLPSVGIIGLHHHSWPR